VYDLRRMEMLMIGVPILLGAAAIWWYVWSLSRRRMGMRAFAAAEGFDFVARPTAEYLGSYPTFAPFGRTGTRISNLVVGRRGEVEWQFFDYVLSSSNVRRRSDWLYGVASARVAQALPEMSVEPEGWFDKALRAMGVRDVRVGDEEFDRRFHVRAADESAAKAILSNAGVREHLMAAGNYRWQLEPGRVLVWKRDLFRPRELPAAMEAIRGLIQRLPEVVAGEAAAGSAAGRKQ